MPISKTTLAELFEFYKEVAPESIMVGEARVTEEAFYAGAKCVADIVIGLSQEAVSDAESETAFHGILNEIDTFSKGVMEAAKVEMLAALKCSAGMAANDGAGEKGED